MECPFPAVAHGSTARRRPLDYDEARRALALFADPDAGMHLQSRPARRHRIAPGNDAGAMLAAVRELDEGDAVYFGLNPCPAGLSLGPDHPGVRVADILCRRWLVLDADPPKGETERSATEEEKAAALAVLDAARAYLAGFGWPAPVRIDSGNGWYDAYRIDLPRDQLAQAVLRRLLKAVAEASDRGGAAIDRGVHAANQRVKLPGSWARKGPDTPDRPHRMARLVGVPDDIKVVPIETIRAAAGLTAAGPEPAPRTNGAGAADGPFKAVASSGKGGGAAWARAALERECGKVALATPPGRQTRLWNSACTLGEIVGAGLLAEGEVISGLTGGARSCGLDSDPEVGERGIADTIARGVAQGRQHPRRPPGLDVPASACERVPAGERITYRASSVTPRKVSWLWPGRLPLGKLVTFAGPGGIGKTFVLCDVTARVTAGAEWPFADGECAEPGSVLFLSAEDDPEDTLVPRLIECGADLDRVIFLKNAVQDYFTLADLETLDRALAENPGVRLVVLDPPTSFLGDVDDHKNAELRRLLSPLAGWASRNKVCVVFNTHFNKGSGGKVDAVLRVIGGIAWTTAVRVAHAFVADPDDPDRALFAPMKVNITRRRKALTYRVLPLDDDRARLEWLAEVDTTADQAVNNDTAPKRRRVVASEWLATLFARTSELPSRTVFDRTKAETTLSDDALKEAKEMMGLRARQKTDGEGRNAWFWYWPDDARRRWEEQVRQAKANGHNNGGPPP